MTPTAATIAVAFAAELLPAPIAIRVIERITTRCESVWSAAVETAKLLAQARDAGFQLGPREIDAFARGVEADARRVKSYSSMETARLRRSLEAAYAAAYAAEEARLAQQYKEQRDFEGVARADPHMR